MKILFVCSGISPNKPSPIVLAQGKALSNEHNLVEFFTINRKGIKGYLLESIRLKRFLKNKKYDIIHAHYGLSAITALLAAGARRLVVSFMGDDVLGTNTNKGKVTTFSKWMVLLNKLLARYCYKKIIVKSQEMYNALANKKAMIVPNGVNTHLFNVGNKTDARTQLNWNYDKSIVLFASDPQRPEKNFQLVSDAVQMIKDSNIEIVFLKNIEHNHLPIYYNAADALLMSSFHEGSPNVIKEAMACSCPIVTTNVGDVKWIIGETPGCFISSFDVVDYAAKIVEVLGFAKKNNRTTGSQRIEEIGLDSTTISKEIIDLYKSL